MHQVDQENGFLFQKLFNNIKATKVGKYTVKMHCIINHDDEIKQLFKGQNRINNLKLPPGILAMLKPLQQHLNGGEPDGGGVELVAVTVVSFPKGSK